MKKKIAIIGAGISGLIFANLLKQNSKYDFTIYEKNSSLSLGEGYGVQFSVNSASILNEIGFKNFKSINNYFFTSKKKILSYSYSVRLAFFWCNNYYKLTKRCNSLEIVTMNPSIS